MASLCYPNIIYLGQGLERDAIPTLSECLLPSCVQLQKDICKDVRALAFLFRMFSSWVRSWCGVCDMDLPHELNHPGIDQ